MWILDSPAPSPSWRPVIQVYHDESTFYCNANQMFHWTDDSKQALKQKSLEQAIIVLNFVGEVNSFLEYEGEKARLMLETRLMGTSRMRGSGAQGYHTV